MQILLGLLVILLPLTACYQSQAETDLIRTFYEQYLASLNSRSATPSLPFSHDFESLWQENSRLCESFEGICGFGSGGDIYLDAQDYEDHLTAAKAIESVSRTSHGVVEVQLNLFPSASSTEEKSYYHRRLRYLLKQENGAWVVDDIVYVRADASGKVSESTARQQIASENEMLRHYEE